MLGQSSLESSIQPAVLEGNTNDRSGELIIDLCPPSPIKYASVPDPSGHLTNAISHPSVKKKPLWSKFLSRVKNVIAPSTRKGSISLSDDVDNKTENEATKRGSLRKGSICLSDDVDNKMENEATKRGSLRKGSICLPDDVDNKTQGAATKRRALLVGISYSNPSNTWSPLDGPHGDVDRYWDLLVSA